MTNIEAANALLECAVELAECIDKINTIKERCESISNKMTDNADPEILLGDALIKLAPALAVIVIYQNEYRKESERKK